jgi:hypothetical protein
MGRAAYDESSGVRSASRARWTRGRDVDPFDCDDDFTTISWSGRMRAADGPLTAVRISVPTRLAALTVSRIVRQTRGRGGDGTSGKCSACSRWRRERADDGLV